MNSRKTNNSECSYYLCSSLEVTSRHPCVFIPPLSTSFSLKSSTCLPWSIISSIDGGLVGLPQHGGSGRPGKGLGIRGSKSPTTFGVIATVEGGFLCPTGGIFHDGGIATVGGGWLGPEGGTLPCGSKSPTTPGGIAEYGCAFAIVVKSAVSSVNATMIAIDDAVAPAMLFLLLDMASL